MAPRISAPLAPMAPPSVGVATPMKMVPSTKKIRNSGGTITNVVCCAMCERNRNPTKRLVSQLMIATQKAKIIPKNMHSTTKSAPCVSELRITNQAKAPLATVKRPSEIRPRPPSGSRNPTASFGRPGVAFGNVTVTIKT